MAACFSLSGAVTLPSTKAYAETDITAPTIDSVTVANADNTTLMVSTSSSATKHILAVASDDVTAVADLQYKLQKYNTENSSYEDVTAYSTFSKKYDTTVQKAVLNITGTNGNGKYRLLVKDEVGNETTKEFSVKAWDNTAPTLDVSLFPNSKYSTYRYLTVNGDEGGDGNTNIVMNFLNYYAEKQDDNYTVKTYSEINDWSTDSEAYIDQAGTYQIYVADKFGNMNSSRDITIDELGIDNEPPIVVASIANTTTDSKKLVTIKAKDVARNSSVASGLKGSGDLTCFEISPTTTLSAVTTDGAYTCTSFTADTSTEYTLNIYDAVGNETSLLFNSSNLSTAISNAYTVTFADWNGAVLKTQTVTKGSAASAPSNPTRSGYTFTGWSTSFSNVTSDITVTAQYKADNCTVKWNVNGGKSISDTTVQKGDTISYTSTSKDGYTLSGWFSDSDFNSVWNFNDSVTKDMTLYAKWTESTESDSKNNITINNNIPDSNKTSSSGSQIKSANTTSGGTSSSLSSGVKGGSTSTSKTLDDYSNWAFGNSNSSDSASAETSSLNVQTTKEDKFVTVTFKDQDENIIASEKLPWGSPVYVLDEKGHKTKEFSIKNSRTLFLDTIAEKKGYVSSYQTYTDEGVFILKVKYSKLPDEETKDEIVTTEPVQEEKTTFSDSLIFKLSIIGLLAIIIINIMFFVFRRKEKKNKQNKEKVTSLRSQADEATEDLNDSDDDADDEFTDADSLSDELSEDDSDIEIESVTDSDDQTEDQPDENTENDE